MRKGILVVGVIVALLGVGLLLLGLAGLSTSTSMPSPQTHQVLQITPGLVGSGSATLTWSGANSSFRFSVYQCSDSSCNSQASSTPLAEGAGASGSTSFDVSGGTTYAIVVTSLVTSNSVPVTIALSGISVAELLGIIVLALGAVVAVLGFLLKAKPKRVAAAAPAPEPMFVTKPFTGSQEASVTSVAPPPVRVEPRHEGSEKPVFFEQPEGEAAAATGPSGPTPGSNRPPITCSHCGTLNEPWLVNCRKCRRPLSRTG